MILLAEERAARSRRADNGVRIVSAYVVSAVEIGEAGTTRGIVCAVCAICFSVAPQRLSS